MGTVTQEISPEQRILSTRFSVSPTEIQRATIAEDGLPVISIEILYDIGLTFSEIHGLVIPARTLKHRKEKRQSLSVEESDRTLRLAKVVALADQVFGNHEKALRWLRQENSRLEGRAPLDLLRTEAGGDLVRQMLYQIDEGIYV
jgi:putative toxin-antitoxin system antitoxin component (TIGR02293 family)